MSEFAVELSGYGEQPFQSLEIVFRRIGVIEHFPDSLKGVVGAFIRESSNNSFFKLLQVLSSQNSARERTPGDISISIVFEKRLIFDFDNFAGEHIVVVLSTDGLVQIELFTDRKGVENCFCLPIASGPVETHSTLNYFVKSPANLF